VLAPAERHAFDELVGLGARLREDFTPIELRSAFRALARRYHPDRCPSRTPDDQAHAARIFAFIVGHYRCLAAGEDR
jgi:curved DNA-binding protein CbpA